MRVFVALAVLVGLIGHAAHATMQMPPPEAWQRADQATRRLAPSDFSELPPSVRIELERRGCRIPQTWVGEVRGNVVRGRFTDRSIEDWAVLCSRDRVSSILVFWNASPKTVASLAERPDRDFLQVVAPGEIGFSREITVAAPEDVRTHYEWYTNVEPPVLTHDGIDDAFAEKGSTVWYRQGDRWVKLLGSD
jgi:hypothetical protein